MTSFDNISLNNSSISPLLQKRLDGQTKAPNNPFSTNNQADSVELGNTKTGDVISLEKDFEKTKSQQGLTGKIWDGFKNLLHFKSGSDYVEKSIKDFNNGKITKEQAQEILTKYQDGQNICVDTVADIVSSIAAVGVFSFATGGLGLPVALGLSFLAGAGIKAGGKAFGAKANNRDYDGKNLMYDIVTGGVNGLFAPITNGLGSNLTKTIGAKLGLDISGDLLEQGAKITLKSILLNQSINVAGGTVGKRALALGAGMALDGALGGTTDNVARAALEGKDAKGVAQAGLQGFLGGLIMSPIIGGGFRIAGKAGKKLSQKIFKNNAPDAPMRTVQPKSDTPDTPKAQTSPKNTTQDVSTDVVQPKNDTPNAPKAPLQTKSDTTDLPSKLQVDGDDTLDIKTKADVSNDLAETSSQKFEHETGDSSKISTDTKVKSESVSTMETVDGEAEIKSEKPFDSTQTAQPAIKHYTNDDKSAIINANGIKDHQVRYLKALDDEHFANAEILMNRGYKHNIVQAAELNPEQFEKAIKILDKGYEDWNVHDIARLASEQFKRAEQLIDLGLKGFRIVDVAQLDETAYQNALKLIDKGCNSYFLAKIAKVEPESFDRILAISNYDNSAKELLKTATEKELKFAKAIIYAKSLDNVECLYNKADEFLNLDFEQVFKAKKLLERGTIDYNVVPDLAKLDERQLLQAEKVLSLPQFSDGKKGVSTLAQLEPQEFEKAIEILKIKRFSEDGFSVSELVKLDEVRYAQAKKLFSYENIENYMIPTLANQEEKQFARTLELIDRNFNIRNIMHNNLTHALNIIDVVNLSDEEYARVFKRNLLDKYPHSNIAGLAKIDDDVWSAMSNTSLAKTIKDLQARYQMDVFLPEYGERVQQIGKIAIALKKYAGKNNINELTIKEKRNLLKILIKGNGDLFDDEYSLYNFPEFIREIAGDVKLLPNSQEEYCALLPRLVKAIGISTNELSEDIKSGFYKTLSSIEAPNSRFRTFDFENPNVKLDLTYPRRRFVSDMADILAPLSKEERNIVCNYFGFELISKDNRYFMNGYPVNLNNGVELARIDSPKLKQIIEKMRPLVKNFSENNSIIIKDEPELSEELNGIIKAFPEFITEIGKRQHHTHDYTLDVHSLKVLQGVVNNPKYDKLPDNDKFALKIAALLHDITKQENLRDVMHPSESAYDVYYLLQKLNISEDEKLKIYQIVKDHNWLQRYNATELIDGKKVPISPEQRTKVAKDIAFDLRKGNSFEMASILTEADMRAVKRDGKFFEGLQGVLEQGENEVGEFVKQIKESAIHLPQTKIPKASEIIVDGDKVKDVVTTLADGSSVTNRVIYLEPDMDLSKYGFGEGLNSDDFNVLIHALDDDKKSTIFQALGQVDTDALLSTSYVNYGQGNFHAFRHQGFVLDVDSDDINAGYYRDFGSGYGKDLEGLKSTYLFNGSNKEYRNYISKQLKEILNLDDMRYAELYNKIKNKSIGELDSEYPDVADAMRKLFKRMEGGKRAGNRKYNEMLITRPKIQAVFDYGKSSDISHIPDFLREYAAQNNLPIIYFGE